MNDHLDAAFANGAEWGFSEAVQAMIEAALKLPKDDANFLAKFYAIMADVGEQRLGIGEKAKARVAEAAP